MKQSILFFSLLAGSVLFSPSCKKEKNTEIIIPEENVTAPVPLTFDSLNVQNSVIRVGDETTIIAKASGTNLTYSWQASAGTIVGKDAQVSYGSTCASCEGENTISCTISDGNTSQTKSIIVTIRK